jgi:hypothetical protein
MRERALREPQQLLHWAAATMAEEGATDEEFDPAAG